MWWALFPHLEPVSISLLFYYPAVGPQLDQSFSLSQLLWASWAFFVLYRYKRTMVPWSGSKITPMWKLQRDAKSFSTIVSHLALCSATKGSGCSSAPPLWNPKMHHCIFDCKLQNKDSSFKLGWPKSPFYCFLRISCDLRRAFVVRRKCAHLSVLVCSFGKGGLIMTRGFYLSRPHMQSKQVMSPLRELQSLWALAVSQKLDINQKSLFLSNKIPMNEWGHSSRLK